MLVKRVPLDVPFAYPDQTFTCGPLCIQAVAEYHGKKIPLGVLVIFCETAEIEGTACDAMTSGARLAQLWAHDGYDGTVEIIRDFIDRGYPVIVHLYDPNWPDKGHGIFDQCHHQIVTDCTDTHITMHDIDPIEDSGGPHQEMPIEEFLRIWHCEPGSENEGKRWFLVVAPHQLDSRFKGPVIRKPKPE